MTKLVSGVQCFEFSPKFRTTDGLTWKSAKDANAWQRGLNRRLKATEVLKNAGITMPSSKYVVSIGLLVDVLSKNEKVRNAFFTAVTK